MNTLVEYLYRDADNYKQPNEFVLRGEITDSQILEIMDCLDCGEYFIPEQVDLPANRGMWEYDEESDQPWFELSENSFSKTNRPDDGMCVETLLQAFRDAKGKWDSTIDISW